MIRVHGILYMKLFQTTTLLLNETDSCTNTHVWWNILRNHCFSYSYGSVRKIYFVFSHEMETFSALLAFSAGNSPVTGEFPSQLSVMRSFGVFFGLGLHRRLSKQSIHWWFETPLRLLWRHCKGEMQGVYTCSYDYWSPSHWNNYLQKSTLGTKDFQIRLLIGSRLRWLPTLVNQGFEPYLLIVEIASDWLAAQPPGNQKLFRKSLFTEMNINTELSWQRRFNTPVCLQACVLISKYNGKIANCLIAGTRIQCSVRCRSMIPI